MKTKLSLRLFTLSVFTAFSLNASAYTPPVWLIQQAFPGVPANWFRGPQARDYSSFTLDAARTGGNPNAVEVTFSAPVSPTTATNAGNYTIVPAVNVTAARLGTNAFTVILTTSAIPDAGLHTLTVSNVTDTATPPNALPAGSTVPILKAQGVITREFFSGISGAAVSDLTNSAKFPNAPDGVDWPAAFEATANAADNYGLQFAGYVHPPVTGDYAFFIAADEQAALYLSPDANASNKTLIASVPSATAARAYTTFTNQRSAYVRLEAGRAYYVETLLKESTGSDHLAVTWRLRGMSAPAAGDGPIPGAFLSSLTPSAPVSITAQPLPQTVAERAPATFAVTPAGTPAYNYQWLRNGAPIPGATATNYAIASAPYSLDGTAFSVVVSNSFSCITSSPALLTVTPDSTPPAIVRLDGSATLDRVTVSFSEPVTSVTANNSANYVFTSGLTVFTARLQPSGTNVVLTTTPQTPGATYTLTATGVTDTAALHNTAPTGGSFTAWTLTRGFLRREVFSNIGSSTALADLVNNPKFPDSPDQVSFVTQFESPVNIGDNYGQRLLGLLLPPQTGFYVFFASSDDEGALYLSSDASPDNKSLIASVPSATSIRQWNLYPSQQSAPVWLVAGQPYYVEAQMKEGVGGDFISVTWQLPGGSAPTNGAASIAGSYLATYANPAATSLVITQQPVNVTVMESNPTNFTVGVTSSYTPVFYQWQKNGADIPGANSATYTTTRLFRGDDGAHFRCFVSIPGTNLLSAEAVLTVTPDNAPPQAVSAATLTGSDTIGVGFNEPLDPATATNAANYILSTGGQVLRATLRPDGQTVALTVATLTFSNFTMTVNGVKDLAGNTIPATALPVGIVPLEAQDIGIAGDPLEPGSAFTCATNAFDVIGGGSDIWNNHDGFHFDYGQCIGDFDARVQVARIDCKATYSFAAIHLRENLTAGSRHVKIIVTSPNCANTYKADWRTQQDGASGDWPGGNTSGGVPLTNAWVRLTRTNDTLTAWRGTNGVDWTKFAQTTMSFTGRVYLGVATCPVNNGAGQATTAWYRNFTVSPPLLPPTLIDLTIKKAGDPATNFSLDGIYQTTPNGAQSLWQTATSNAPAAYQVQVQNDGTNTLSPVVKAAETTETGWTVTYRIAGQDISAQIRSANGYTVTNLIAGTPETITVEFLPDSHVLGGTPKSAALSVFTDRYTTTLRDTVEATAITDISRQPDLMVRRLTDVIYRGKGVFNADGTGQTKALELDYGMTAVYPIQLINAGNVTNFFNLHGTAGGAGWGVRYFDSVSGGADIAGDMTGGGTIVALPPAASWEGRVEATFDATVPRGSSNTVLVTASSIGNGATSSDTVKIITSVITTSDIALAGLYTTDADFERGTLVGLEYGNDQLQLSREISVLPFIWVPNSNEGTVSKVDTRTGREIARYRTCPAGVNGQPSRTTVDQLGNCWVANRQSGAVVKIGLLESGQFLDRNGNGVADTSQDTNGDGDITGAELLPWGQDECVLYEVILIPGKEGTFTPGNYAGGYVDNYWNPGPRGIAVDYIGNVWAGTHDAMKYYYLDGSSATILRTNDTSAFGHMPYGAVIDGNGILWSSGYRDSGQNSVLRLDPKDNSMSAINFEFHTYGLGLDRNNHLFVSGHQEAKLSRINVLTGSREWTVNAGYLSRGVTCTDDGDVWVACSSEGTVWRFSNDGVFKNKLTVGSTPTGVSVDAAGKVWVVNDGDEYINRIDPAIGAFGAIDLSKRIIGGLHYGYSDMTGVIARSTTTRLGTWTIRHNSRVEFTPWSALTWHGTNLVVTNIVGSITTVLTNCTVRVRSSNNQQQWSGWERVANGYPLAATPPGQYLEIEVTLQQLSPDASPVLYDINVTPVPQGVADLEVRQSWSATYAWWPLTNRITVINHGPDDASGLVLTSSLPASLTFISAASSQGSLVQSNGLLRWNLGSLANGATLQAEAVVIATNTATFTNCAGVKAYETDPQTNNNLTSVILAVMQAPCQTPPAGLVSWWPGDGSAADFMGLNPGAFIGGATTSAGKAGNAFSLNGSAQYVSIPDSPSLHVTNLTLECWVNFSALGGTRHLIAKTYGGGSDNSYVVWMEGGNLRAYITGGPNFDYVWNPTLGRWYHVAYAFSDTANTHTLYVDGKPVAAQANSATILYDTHPLFIGADYLNNAPYAYLSGMIDEVSIFDRALNATEIQALYLADSGGKCKGSVGVWLTIAPTLSGVVLRWPAAAAGWQLQSVDTLSPGSVWQPESTPPLFTNSVYQLTLPAANAQRFYRLKAP